MKKKITALLTVGLLVMTVFLAGCSSGSSVEKAIKGDWECTGILLSGYSFSAEDMGIADDTAKFEKESFTLQIVDTDYTGTWKYQETDSADDGTEYSIYMLSLDSGESWAAILFNKDGEETLTVCFLGGGSVDSDNFLIYKRAS